MMDRLPVIRNMAALEQLIEGRIEPDDDAIKSVIDMNPDAWDRSGSALKPALATSDRAQRTQRPEDIAAALLELQAVWVRLSAGNPMRAQVLVPIAMQRAFVAVRTGQQQTAVDAAGTAVAALRAAIMPAERDAAAQLTVNVLVQMLNRGQFGGPFREVEEVARGALAGLGDGDSVPRVSLQTAVGAAMAMRAHAHSDEPLRAAAQQVIAEAERLLPEPEPTSSWFAAARLLFAWTGVYGVCLGDAEASAIALRLADSLEAVLARSPAAANPSSGGEGSDSIAAAAEGIRQLREQAERGARTGDGHPAGPSPAAAEAVRLAAQRGVERAVAVLHPGDPAAACPAAFRPGHAERPGSTACRLRRPASGTG